MSDLILDAISFAEVGGLLHACTAAIKAYRAGKPSFPEGTIIGRVAWKMVPSEENNKTFGQAQSFVPGDAPDWYLQFMEKNTKKYAATGGWGYSNFGKDLKPLTDEKMM